MDSPETIFNPLSLQFSGIGTTVRLLFENYDTNLGQVLPISHGIIRVQTSVNDLDSTFLGLSNTTADNLWIDAAAQIPYAQSMVDLSMFEIFFYFAIPNAWLTAGNPISLDSYSTLIVAGFNYFTNILGNTNIIGVEVCSNPELPNNHISPLDVTYLAQKVKNIATARNLIINLIGPSISQVPPITVSTDYNETYLNVIPSSTFQSFSIYGYENLSDINIINAADYGSRTYMQTQLQVAATSANYSVNIQKFISKLSTIATTFPGISQLFAPPSNYPAYSLRLAENFIGALNSSFGTILFDKLTYDSSVPGDQDTLYDSSLLKRPVYDLLQFFNNLPLNSAIYRSELLNTNDETMKVLLMNTDSMGFSCIMSRPITDTFNGLLTFKIVNSLWSSAYQFVNFTFSAFPESVDTSACSVVFSEITDDLSNGIGIVKIDNLPLDCIIILQGTVDEIPPVNPPLPIAPNILLETIVQVFINNGMPSIGTIVPGSIYYDLSTNLTMVYDSVLGWLPVTLYNGLN